MFTPDKFAESQTSNYMKFGDGANKIRILKEPVTGYEYWLDADGEVVPRGELAGKGGKPVRARQYDGFNVKQKSAMKAFCAMIVWNYQASKVQILEVKQVGIMNSFEALATSKSWGDITTFDVVITKTKTGPETRDVEYSVMPEPKEELTKEVLDAYNAVSVNLEALFTGGEPFGSLSDEEMNKISEDLDA